MLATMTEAVKREIRAQLKRRGLTQKAFADELSISEVQLSRMMSGKTEGSVRAWQEICNKLGLEITVKAVS